MVRSGVEHEVATNPKGHGWPGLGLGTPARGVPWKKSPKLRLGEAGGRSLNSVSTASIGGTGEVLLIRLLSGYA